MKAQRNLLLSLVGLRMSAGSTQATRSQTCPRPGRSNGGIEHRVSVEEGSGSPDHLTGFLPRRRRLAGRREP